MEGPRRWVFKTVILLLLAAWTAAAADSPQPSTSSDSPPRMPRADSESAVGPDGLQLPPDAKAVVLPREKYQELINEIARLREQLKPGKPLVPSFCELTGKVDGGLVRLRAQFKFRTERDNQLVALGCASGSPTDAKLDGQLPNLTKSNDSGFVVQVDKAGEHKFQLDLDLPVTGKENERSLALDLPGAAVTTLELDLPEGVHTARVGPDTFKAEPLENKRNRVKGPLGPLQRLDVAWILPESGTPLPPLLAAETHIAVRVEETQVVTEAELTLKTLRGEPAEWLLQVPPQAELKKQGLDERIQSVVEVDPKRSARVLRLTGPSSKELKITFRVSQPRANKPIPVGPFAAPAAARQQGTLTVSAAPEVSLVYHPRGDLSPRPLTDEERRRDPNLAAAFRYWSLPGLEKPLIDLNQPVPPLVDLEIQTVKGEVEARVRYDLRLVKPDGEGRPFWRLTTTVEGTAYRARAELLRVQLPPAFQIDEKVGVQPAELVQGPEVNPATRVAQFTLLNKKPEHFQVIFQGTYAALGEDECSATLDLPQPLGVLDRGGIVALGVPDDWKLLSPKLPGWREPMILEPHKQTWRYDQTPTRVRMDWQPTRPEANQPVKPTATPAGLRIERTLIQVTVGTSGYQNYRGWFLVKPAGNKTLDVKLPAPLAGLDLRVFLDGKPIQTSTVDESGNAVEVGEIARIPLAEGESGLVILRVEYKLPPGRAGGSGLLQTALQPPMALGDPVWTPIRWQVSLPSSALLLDADPAFRVEQDWKLRGWLLGMRPAQSGPDSEGWSFGAEAAGMPPTPEGEEAPPRALVGWQTMPGPLRLTHAPQQGWLLGCSLTVLALGLAASLLLGLSASRFNWLREVGWILALAAILTMAALTAVLGLFWPNVLSALAYGSEPGLLVLFAVLCMQWLLQQRYRRQVVFLPGFQRAKPGSSVQRVGSSNRPRVEPTTVDVPPPAENGPRPTGSGVKVEGSAAKAVGDSRNG